MIDDKTNHKKCDYQSNGPEKNGVDLLSFDARREAPSGHCFTCTRGTET